MPYNSDEQRNMRTLCHLINKKRVIPIIGFDLHNIKPGDDILLEIAKECYLEKSAELISSLNLKNGYEVINAIYHKLSHLNKITFHSEIELTIKDKYTNLGLRPDALKQLAKIKKFDFYINATFFNFLEFAISVYRVPQSSAPALKNYEVAYYHPRNPEDIKINVDPAKEMFEKPTVYNMLGTLGRSNNEYVLTDVDYMELLVKMISNENGRFTSLKTAVKDATLLFIGCDFPDWILRMFLKFYLSGRQYSQEDLEKNFIIEQLTDDPGKSFFIGSYGIKKFNTPPGQFIKDIYDQLSKPPFIDCIEERYSNHPVFISYNHDDQELVDCIQQQLESHSILVWKDHNNMRSGGRIDDEVKSAIDNACTVIPILTNKVQEATPAKYYPKEWNYVCDSQNYSIKLVPVRTKDYVNNSLPNDVFHENTKKLLLVNGDGQLIYETLDSANCMLSEAFINRLKEAQYKAALSQIKMKF